MPNNDLAIYLKILLQDQSKSTIVTDVDKLVATLQEKLNKISININSSSLSQLTSQLEKLNEFTQKISKSSTQNIQITKELDGTVKKYSETIKANGEVVQKTTEIIDKNKIAKQQSASSQIINNITKETDAVNKLNSEYGKLIRTVKSKKANGDPLRQDQTYLNSKTGVKTTVTSRPNQENTYKTDNDYSVKKNADALKEQMKLARESAKLAKESNDYQQKYYKVQQKQFDDNNKEYLRGVKLKEKAEENAKKVQVKSFDEGNKEFARGIKLKQKLFDDNNKEYLRGIKLKQVEETKQYKVKDTTQAQKDKFNAELDKLNNSKYSKFVDASTEQNIRKLITELNNLNKTSLGKIKTEIDILTQNANNDFNKTKDNIIKTEQQLNKLNNVKIKALKLEAKVDLLPSGEVGVEKLKKSLEAYKNIISKSEFKIKNGEFISEKQLRNLDFAREKLNILQAELKKIYSTSSTGTSAKAVKLFDFNTTTSELIKFKYEVDKIKSSLSVGGNIVNKSSIDEFGRLNLEIRN